MTRHSRTNIWPKAQDYRHFARFFSNVFHFSVDSVNRLIHSFMPSLRILTTSRTCRVIWTKSWQYVPGLWNEARAAEQIGISEVLKCLWRYWSHNLTLFGFGYTAGICSHLYNCSYSQSEFGIYISHQNSILMISEDASVEATPKRQSCCWRSVPRQVAEANSWRGLKDRHVQKRSLGNMNRVDFFDLWVVFLVVVVLVVVLVAVGQ